ncbi:MAG: hypothetical protein GY739_05435, partial [Mesoflavibacter sp.]|nr:hypothetical protein [Mesoflavibacter sp.]
SVIQPIITQTVQNSLGRAGDQTSETTKTLMVTSISEVVKFFTVAKFFVFLSDTASEMIGNNFYGIREANDFDDITGSDENKSKMLHKKLKTENILNKDNTVNIWSVERYFKIS